MSAVMISTFSRFNAPFECFNFRLAIYKSRAATFNFTMSNANLQSSAKVKLDKYLGWIPNPRTEMKKFYNNVYQSFYLERRGAYCDTKKDFTRDTPCRRQILGKPCAKTACDSGTIKQKIIHIDDLQKSIDKIEKTLKEHLKKPFIQLSGRILTGHNTAHDFGVAQLSQLQSVKTELTTLRTRLVKRQETCEFVFRHRFSAIKRKSRSRKQNINKCKKRMKAKHSERKREILRKIAPDSPEGKPCINEDIRPAIVRGPAIVRELKERFVFRWLCRYVWPHLDHYVPIRKYQE
ncbi:Hypothetical predicted protein [Paramuricea clavata]|uniref:Uncharacterized protein n=1 Tax=Paramuricea clavata TaxID=317549 RepID=A0A6S7HMK9_PARCT|nr:Hypothetical predicted protein [Paramuricea clavata]